MDKGDSLGRGKHRKLGSTLIKSALTQLPMLLTLMDLIMMIV
jgi:hypothetical protein